MFKVHFASRRFGVVTVDVDAKPDTAVNLVVSSAFFALAKVEGVKADGTPLGNPDPDKVTLMGVQRVKADA